VRTIEVEPVLGNIRSSTEILNGVVDRTNSALEALNRQAQRGDNESHNRSINNFNAAKDIYNSNVRKLDELQREIAHE
jgi:ABC-type transporter Mla subunit MlaD